MEKFIIFVQGLRLEKDFTFTFCNGFTLCHFSQIDDKNKAEQLESFVKNTDYYILVKEHAENYFDTIEEARDIVDIISIHFEAHHAITVSSPTTYTYFNIPRIDNLKIRKLVDLELLEKVNHQLSKLNELELKMRKKIRVSLRFLNKAADLKEMNPSVDHFIFIRVAMENIFGAPYDKIRNTISERASILLTEYNEAKVISGFKKFYDLTSRVIHTGIVPQKTKKSKYQKVIIDGKSMYELLILSVSKILENGFPNWKNYKLSFRQRFKIKVIKLIDEKF